jgi:hypothetical protein
MKNVIERLPERLRSTFLEAVSKHDEQLLVQLRAKAEPSKEEREKIEEILADEYMLHVDSDYNPTEKGQLIDDTLGEFLICWPISHEQE